MKKLTLSTACFLLLAAQLNAQSNVVISTTTNANVSVNVNTPLYAVNTTSTNLNVNTSDVQDGDPVKSKTFTKSFVIDKNDKVNLSNQFGGITIKTWDKNEIKVDVDIKAYAKTDADAQKLLDQVSISASKDGDMVAFKTNMEDRSGNWGSSRNGKNSWRREAKVFYVVYMPAGNSLTASQQYGNIVLDDFSGPTSLKVQYGNLNAGNLTNSNNYISIQYGKGTVKDMGGATIKHQYGGGVTIGNVGNLDLNAQYTSANISSVRGTAIVKHQYGSGTTIGSVSGTISVNTQYAPIKIGNLKGDINCRAQYGKVIVDDIEAGKDVNVDAQYSSVSLGFATNYNADFEVKTQYGGFSYGSNVNAKKQGEGERDYSQNKNYIGQIGKGGSAKVLVKTQYNSVTFK